MSATRVMALASGALLLSIAAITQTDPDLWGHVRFGIDILETRDLPVVDPYSFTQDRPWINHEWLSELFMGVAWTVGGTPGLTLLKALLALSAVLVVWRVYRDADLGWRMAMTAAAVVSGAQLMQTLRPQLWSLVAIALLAAHLQAHGPRRPWLLFALFCVWANAHGGWIVGLGVVGVWAAMEAPRDRSRVRAWTAAVLAAVAGTFATPYGWGLWGFMFETVRLTRPQIEDWLPLWDVSPEKWVLWALIVAWSVWLWHKLPRSRVATACVLVMLAAASLKVVRILPLFGIASVVLLAPAVTAWRPRRALTPLRPHEERLTTAVIVAACLAGALWVGRASFTCIRHGSEWMPDREVIRVLSQAPPGRLVTFFNWGEYAIWHLGPRIRVSMDGRRETVYSDHRLQEHDDILYGRSEGFQVLGEWQPEYVWLPASSTATKQWLVANGYRVEIERADSFLAMKSAVAGVLSPLPGGGSDRCFPD